MAFATQCKNCGQLAPKDSGTPLLPEHPSNADRRLALAKIKSQIALYKKYIAALEEQADELEEDLALIVYPVLSLPLEITSTIFVHCLPSHGRVKPSSSRAPLLLAQICHDWREIALATCALWRSVYITPPTRVARHRGTSAVLQTWLSRASARRVSLGLNFESGLMSSQLSHVVSSFAGQIQRLDLHLSGDQFRKLRLLRAHFPHLQHLALKNWADSELAEFLQQTPSIRELRLLDEDHQFPSDLCLTHLTRLDIFAEISTTTLLRLLGTSPLLTNFTFALRESDAYSSSPTWPTLFPNLSSLALRSDASVWALRSLTLPALRELTLAIPPYFGGELTPEYFAPEDVHNFVLRSSCFIEHLTITFHFDEDGGTDQAERWLTLFPSVTVLHVKECPDPEDLWDWLQSEESMPHLKELTLDFELNDRTLGQNHDYALLALLHNRRGIPGCAALRKLQLKFTLAGTQQDEKAPLGPLAFREVEQLIKDGLDFLYVIKTSSYGHSESRFWPSTYVAPDPLPLFP
ncbi:hypothetical protein C8R46DRAFT_1361877 [Mycena filopes]|nr:hypothetical protein C8R46DRAFT_1361877 [Mycena filopes]